MKHILLVAALSAALMGCRDSEVTNASAEAEPHGQAMAAGLGPLLKTFFDAVDPPARQTAIAAIRAAAPDLQDVERGLRQGRNYPAHAPKGWPRIAVNTFSASFCGQIATSLPSLAT